MTTYLEAHIIQTLPPSNINRDREGMPKTCLYGGVPRARVSSQAWKRAMREMFQTLIDPSKLGIRSREFAGIIADKLNMSADDENLLKVASLLMKKTGLMEGNEKPGTLSAIQFLGAPQWAMLADTAREALDSKDAEEYVKTHSKELRARLAADHSIDVALFGRMTASDDKHATADYSIDAACQVAHAFSVNRADVELDFYTALDEHAGASGAAMLQDTGFTSSTLYRYAVLDINLLDRNLDHDKDALRETVQAWLTAFIKSMPGGKKNAFAPETMPSFILTDIRTTRPINLADAFQTPVEGDITASAVTALTSRFEEMETVYGEPAPYTRITAGRLASTTLDQTLRDDMVPLPQLITDMTDKAMEA